jgi:hypothetical protein
MPTTDPRRFRHRTAEVEAVQWTGSNAEQMRAFCGPDFDEIDPEDRGENPDATAAVRESAHGEWRGLEPGWWAVKIGDQLYEESDADFKASFEPAASSPQPDHVTAIYDAIDAFQRQFRTVGLQHAQIRASLAEYLARELPAVVSSPPATDRATLLLWAADQIDAETRQAKVDGVLEPDKYRPCRDASAQLRRMAVGARQPDTETQERTEEQVVRDHVTTVHLIGEQLAGIESWLWERLAEAREQTVQHAPGTAILCSDCRAKGYSVCVADETGEATPCSQPNPCEDGGDPCDRHEREQAHAEGEHAFCGDECAEADHG